MLTKIDVIFGFQTDTILNSEQIELLYDNGIFTSPVCYNTSDYEPSSFIVGLSFADCLNVKQVTEIKFDSTKVDEYKKRIYELLDKCEFDVPDKECRLYLNAFHY